MKIGVISDLHIDRSKRYTPEDFERHLCNSVQSQRIDVLLIAGDISNNYQLSAQFIKTIKTKLQITVLFVPGNHDFWTQSGDLASLEILDYYMAMQECLIGQPYIINDEWAIVGNTGWYDYSYADSRFSLERIEQRKYIGATWQDKERINWPIHDRKMSDIAVRQITKDIQQVADKKLILMTHIVTHNNFTVPMPHRIFDYFNAFIGTSDFDQIYDRYPIHYSIMGHVHFRNHFEEQGTTYICPCLGYERQWRTTDLAREITQSLYTFNI
ncbi:metallophosphoesterase [Staphylococcus arlettae]|uniref:metallophosphoesterase n=1 Tax=Staphylococcus arlettae TaxID=29378 RepID=UPI0021CE75D6|nr:metallophosphoesterase [Staphylococcus arlettae]UXU53051.1 metallophosphoesterase [Staphylococcus arlettae]